MLYVGKFAFPKNYINTALKYRMIFASNIGDVVSLSLSQKTKTKQVT